MMRVAREISRWMQGRSLRMAPLAGLLTLSFLWTLGTVRNGLLPSLMPAELPAMQRQAIALALLTFILAVFNKKQRYARPRGWRFWRSVLIGMGLFVVPALLIRASAGHVTGFARSALLTLTPVFSLVLEPHFEPDLGGTAPRQSKGALRAALVCTIGAICVLPFSIPESLPGTVSFCGVMLASASIAVANCLGVQSAIGNSSRQASGHSSGLASQPFSEAALAPMTLARMALTAAATGALGLMASSTLLESVAWGWDVLAPALLWAALVDLPALLLLFWLMGQLSASRMAVRYVLAPLLAVLFGAALLQSAVSARTWLGMLLMAGGAAYLLLAPAEEFNREGLFLN